MASAYAPPSPLLLERCGHRRDVGLIQPTVISTVVGDHVMPHALSGKAGVQILFDASDRPSVTEVVQPKLRVLSPQPARPPVGVELGGGGIVFRG